MSDKMGISIQLDDRQIARLLADGVINFEFGDKINICISRSDEDLIKFRERLDRRIERAKQVEVDNESESYKELVSSVRGLMLDVANKELSEEVPHDSYYEVVKECVNDSGFKDELAMYMRKITAINDENDIKAKELAQSITKEFVETQDKKVEKISKDINISISPNVPIDISAMQDFLAEGISYSDFGGNV